MMYQSNQPSKSEMQRYIDEMMRYRSQWTKNVTEAARRSRTSTAQAQPDIDDGQAVLASSRHVDKTPNTPSAQNIQSRGVVLPDITLDSLEDIGMDQTQPRTASPIQPERQSVGAQGIREDGMSGASGLNESMGMERVQERTNTQPGAQIGQSNVSRQAQPGAGQSGAGIQDGIDQGRMIGQDIRQMPMQPQTAPPAQPQRQEMSGQLENPNVSTRPEIPYYPTPLAPLSSIPRTSALPNEQDEDQAQMQDQIQQNMPSGQESGENMGAQVLEGESADINMPPPSIVPENSPVDITIEEQKPVDLDRVYKNFSEVFPHTGYIMVQTLTARRTFPVPNAIVEISKDFIQGRRVISRQVTDMSGRIKRVEVPAVGREYSEKPGNIHPYTTYTITVKHPEYATLTFQDVPVFEGIESWQTVDMIPLSAMNGNEEQTDFIEDRSFNL